MSDTIVSIIIPVYNGALLLNRCLDSVFVQNDICDLDVIVIDDGSTDNSVELVKGYTHQVRLFQQPNQGPAAARNMGIESAKGNYLAFIDADDYWLPDFLTETVGYLEKNNNVIAVSVGQMIKISRKPDTVSPSFLSSEPPRYSEAIQLPDFFEFWAEHNHVCTGSVLMRTDIVKRTGGQRPELRITEDLEFWAYLATFGPWGFIPKVLFVGDGGLVTKQLGWIEKNRKRWASAPSIDEWEKRIKNRIYKPLSEGYLLARGRIAANLTYSMILSSRPKIARQTVLKYKQYFPSNKLTKLLKVAALFAPFWYLVCWILRMREYSREISIPTQSS
jgi:glycosyltransferase involved in cell wall biosynthesis